jgi:hypothetical protein
MDHYKSRKFISSYLLNGNATIQYLKESGDAVYTPVYEDNPILAVVNQKNGEITINKVGKVLYEITASNGTIIVMNNMANVSYCN